jgi:hypothetical protein
MAEMDDVDWLAAAIIRAVLIDEGCGRWGHYGETAARVVRALQESGTVRIVTVPLPVAPTDAG